MSPATRAARCACGRLELTAEGEPLLVLICHCDFCQKRSGNVYIASAHFAEEQISITGESKIFNGLEIDGVPSAVPGGIDYHFCPTCSSTLFWVAPAPMPGQRERVFAVAVGNFVDPDFPMPTTELSTKHRHHWVPAVPDAAQVYDPLDGSAAIDEMVPSFKPDAD